MGCTQNLCSQPLNDTDRTKGGPRQESPLGSQHKSKCEVLPQCRNCRAGANLKNAGRLEECKQSFPSKVLSSFLLFLPAAPSQHVQNQTHLSAKSSLVCVLFQWWLHPLSHTRSTLGLILNGCSLSPPSSGWSPSPGDGTQEIVLEFTLPLAFRAIASMSLT